MLEDHGAAGEDISHMRISQSDELIVRARADEAPTEYHSFTFFGAWSENPILVFVATRLSSTDVEGEG